MGPTTSADQFLLVLDIDSEVRVEEAIERLAPHARHRLVKRLSELGYTRPTRRVNRDELNWPIILAAIRDLASWMRAQRRDDDHPVEVYVCGLAPLSAFFALGVELDRRRVSRVVSINQRRTDATWDVLPLDGAPGTFFGVTPSQVPSEATGCVAVFVSCQVPDVPTGRLRDFVVDFGAEVAGIVPVVTPTTRVINSTTVGPMVRELTEVFSALPATWPYRSCLAVTLAGPASMALAAGLAVNPNQHTGGGARIVLGEYVGGQYRAVGEIPASLAIEPTISHDPESKRQRAHTLTAFRAGIEALQVDLSPASVQFPAGFTVRGEAGLRHEIVSTIEGLELPEEAHSAGFDLRVLEKRLDLGAGLVEALKHLDTDVVFQLGQLFLLHEVVHDYQGLSSHNYRGIGRAGVVLEDVDFWADAFAIRVAFEHQLESEANASAVLTGLIDAHIEAMRAFDRMEQGGDELKRLPERRLRRYLIWYLQRARAAVVHDPDDARCLLDARLFVELSPLRARLDDRYDKLVVDAMQGTVLTVSLGAQVKRLPALPGSFSPQSLVRAVRAFDAATLADAMSYVVAEAKAFLVPWGASHAGTTTT